MWASFQSDGVRGILHRPDNANGDALILTHGAGSNANAPLLVRVAAAFADAGYLALRYDLPFRQQRPKGPPNPRHAAQDREGIERAAEALRGLARGRIFAGGHSYGGRQTAKWAAARGGRAPAAGGRGGFGGRAHLRRRALFGRPPDRHVGGGAAGPRRRTLVAVL